MATELTGVLRERITLYLSSMGATRPIADAYAERICSQLPPPAPEVPETTYIRHGFRAFLEHMIPSGILACPSPGEENEIREKLLLWRLRSAAHEYAGKLGPQEMATGVAANANHPMRVLVLPMEMYREMPVQSLGPTPRLLRADYWRQYARRCLKGRP